MTMILSDNRVPPFRHAPEPAAKRHYCDGDCCAQFDWQERWIELQFNKQVVLPVALRLGA